MSCSVDGCDKPSRARGWCRMHYVRWHRHGDPLIALHIHRDDPKRFLSYVEPAANGCWLWTGPMGAYGYGIFGVGGKTWSSHRWAYEFFVGPVPEGLELDHTCHNNDETCVGGFTCLHRRCVNPAHLEAVTHLENVQRGHKGKATRRQGVRPYSPSGDAVSCYDFAQSSYRASLSSPS